MANDFDIDSLDPETLAELRRLSRREQMANELYGRSNQPLQGQMVGGIYVKPSPLQGIANLAGAYMSGRERNAIDEGYKALGEKSAANKTAAWQRMSEALTGKPEEQLPPNVFGPPRPAVEGSMERAFQVGMESPYTRESAKAIALEMMKQKMKGIEPYTLGPGQVRFGPDGRQMAAVPNKPDNQPTSIDEYNFAKGQGYTGSFQDWMKDKAQVTRINVAPPVTPVTIQDPNDPNSTIIIDGRTKQVLGKGPKLTESGKLENKRQFNMQGLGQTIQEAEDLLTGASGKALPTGSSLGAAVDWAGGLVGMNPEGATEAQTLKAIGGALTSKMPRMEGPQSDKDTQLYREMAAVVGDSTVPRERRLAALGKVKELWGKYEKQQHTKPAPAGGAKFLGFE